MFRNLTPLFKDASVAQLVEHHLAKVNVEGSNPFARSISPAKPLSTVALVPFAGVLFSYVRPNQLCMIEAEPQTTAPTQAGIGVKLMTKIRMMKPYCAN